MLWCSHFIAYAGGCCTSSQGPGVPPALGTSHRRECIGAAASALLSGEHRFIGYAGRFSVHGAVPAAPREPTSDEALPRQAPPGAGVPITGTVIHHLLTCSYPNWVGTRQERLFRVEGHRLILTTPPLVRLGVRAVATLVWEREG